MYGVEERLKTVVYGKSAFIAGVESGLRNVPGLDVVWIDATLPDAAQRVRALHPDAVILEYTDLNSPFVIPFLKDYPGFLLIGLDPNSDTVLVLSKHRRTVLAIDDLAQVIRQETRKAECEKTR